MTTVKNVFNFFMTAAKDVENYFSCHMYICMLSRIVFLNIFMTVAIWQKLTETADNQ